MVTQGLVASNIIQDRCVMKSFSKVLEYDRLVSPYRASLKNGRRGMIRGLR